MPFAEGAAICAVTDRNAVAMAVTDAINGTIVTGELFTWVPDDGA